MILPLLPYCGIVNLNTTKTQQEKYRPIERRSAPYSALTKCLQSEGVSRKRSNLIVRSSLNGSLCSNFKKYVSINDHDKATRNGKLLLKLPKVELEFAPKSTINNLNNLQ